MQKISVNDFCDFFSSRRKMNVCVCLARSSCPIFSHTSKRKSYYFYNVRNLIFFRRNSARISNFFSSVRQNFSAPQNFSGPPTTTKFLCRNFHLTPINGKATVSPDPISEPEFEEIAETTLDSLTEYLEELGDSQNVHPDFDVN